MFSSTISREYKKCLLRLEEEEHFCAEEEGSTWGRRKRQLRTTTYNIDEGTALSSLADPPNDGTRKWGKGVNLPFKDLVILALAAGSATLGVTSATFIGSPVSISAGVIALVVAVVVVLQYFLLARLSTFRQVHHALRQDLNYIGDENYYLEDEITRLEREAQLITAAEKKIRERLGSQRNYVDKFVNLVKENRELSKKIQEAIIAQSAYQIMSAFLLVDRDRDFKISETELQRLVYKIRAIKGVASVDEFSLRQILKENPGLAGVHAIIAQVKENRGLLLASELLPSTV